MAPAAKSPPAGQSPDPVPRGLVGLGAAFVVLLAFRASGAAAGGDEPPAPPVCDSWHRGAGELEPVDLERVRRGYAELKERLSGSLRRGVERELGSVGRQGYDLGLPACTRPRARQFRPGRDVPPELREKRLWFFRLEGENPPALPEDVCADPSVLLLAVRTPDLGALERASRSWGRPVTLAPRGLAEALGVRCAPAFLSISGDGEVEIHENP